MSRHDIHIGRGKVQAHVQEHIKEEHGKNHPEQLLPSAHPDTQEEESNNQSFCDVESTVAVSDKHRAVFPAMRVFQRIGVVQN